MKLCFFGGQMVEVLAREFSKKAVHIENLINLHNGGNTVPFIARYRKEQTGSLDENEIREILERYSYLENLEKRKSEVIKAIKEKGKLTETLQKNILAASTLKDVEDLYAPYKSKRKTKADIAKDFGLFQLAQFIKSAADEDEILEKGEQFINENVVSKEDAVEKALDILIEEIGHNIKIKNRIREVFWQTGRISVSKSKDISGRTVYEDYYDYEDEIKKIPSHRLLAIFRGEKNNVLKVKFTIDEEVGISSVKNILIQEKVSINNFVQSAVVKSYKRMILPSIELEIKKELKESAEDKAIKVFEENLKNILLTPPVKNRKILGIDPAFRTGCKFAAIDETGKVLNYGVIYPVDPQNEIEKSEKTLLKVIEDFKIDIVAIGNGTASRPTEEFISNMIAKNSLKVFYTIVSEAGASVYSASKIANEEFPDLDLTIRGAISIARRVQDPLSELVKIEPKSIGVGMYQHDVNQRKLQDKLNNVVEDVVNRVGVDLNTAGYSILSYISGLNEAHAQKIVEYREKHGRFNSRMELLKIPGIGENTFRQCAGFLKIYDGSEILDKMFIHPESYDIVYRFINMLNLDINDYKMIKLVIRDKNMSEIAEKLDVGLKTLNDIIDNLVKPHQDIRDNIDPVIFKKGVVDIDNLEIGMVLTGKITNVVDFGAFVDLGLKNDGMIHISEMADKFIKNPNELLSVGDIVNVKILSIDKERKRVSLSMKI
jgi:uncharacterized protein